MQQENNSLKDEVNSNLKNNFFLLLFKSNKLKINSKNDINRDLKHALTSSNNDTQTIYTQFRQLNLNLNDSNNKYEQEIEQLRSENKQIIVNYSRKNKLSLAYFANIL